MTSQDDAIQCDKIESTTSSYDRLSLPSETSSYDRLSLMPAPVDVASEEFDQVRSKPEREGGDIGLVITLVFYVFYSLAQQLWGHLLNFDWLVH